MDTLARRKFVELLALGAILSLPVLNCVSATNTSENSGQNETVFFHWKVPAEHQDAVKDALAKAKLHSELTIADGDVKSPWLVIFSAAIFLRELCNVIGLLLCQRSAGIVIYAGNEKVDIETDPNLFRGTLVLHTKDGTEFHKCWESDDSSEFSKKIFEALLR
jgi:hypothetical protein